MTAFSAAADALFADDNLAEPATYESAAGAAVMVRVIRSVATDDVAFGEPGFRGPRLLADVRSSEVAAPARGDRLTVGTDSYEVRGVVTDALGLVHTLELREAAG